MRRATSLACPIVMAAGSLLIAGESQAGTFDFHATITGDQEVPPVDTQAMGTATGTYDSEANEFSFSWEIEGPLNGEPTQGAHIHNAPPGVNGPVVFPIAGGEWSLSGSDVWTDLTDEDVDNLFAGDLYLNFHTDAHPGGEIRGQIVPAPGPVGVAAAFGGLAGLVRRRR